MRIVNADGRLGLLTEAGVVDVETASGGRFGSDPQAVYAQWAQLRSWATEVELDASSARPLDDVMLGAPAPRPSQVFAIGLNYWDHAEESGLDASTESLVVFTKFPSSITGPFADIVVPAGSVDFEVELVVVIGEPAYRVAEQDAWLHVAGLTVGQDVSERELQLRPPNPQFSLGKSFPGFAPMGPCLVTVDEFADPDDIEIGCVLNGEQMQKGRTSNMIFPVPAIIARLSATLPLLPGDVIFTGTPAGVGWARDPKVFLHPGDELTSTAATIGTIRNRFVAASTP